MADAAPLYLGLISGTSADGIDVALVRFGSQPDVIAARTIAYPEELRAGVVALALAGAESPAAFVARMR